MKTYLKQLTKMANKLDKMGFIEEADMIDEILKIAGDKVTLFKGEERTPVLDLYGFMDNRDVCERLKQYFKQAGQGYLNNYWNCG